MGGCRCTYRNCTMKTDGKTHMFHYPVFDKVRCHQWLTNANRLDFLNLKVSQLRNRVVCQHHFKDENFMNFLKDKLTFEAVPTEDGPYCDSSSWAEKKPTKDADKVYLITVDDIENDLYLNDKKANFSMKYGDFLTNCDVMDQDNINQTTEHNTLTSVKKESYGEPINATHANNSDKMPSVNNNNSLYHKISVSPDVNKKYQTQPMLIVPPYSSDTNIIPVEFEQQRSLANKNNLENVDWKNGVNLPNQITYTPNTQNNQNIKKETKVKILSQKKISEPVPVIGRLEPVSPSAILRVPKKTNVLEFRRNRENKDISQNLPNVRESIIDPCMEQAKPNSSTVKSQDIERIKTTSSLLIQKNRQSLKKNENNQIKPSIDASTNISVIKSKIPPERVAAIEEKRKFNMKLRNIIEASLNKLEEQEETNKESISIRKENTKDSMKKEPPLVSKEPNMPNIHQYTISCLEARLKKMEESLLSKIEQNSQKIIDVKNILASNSQKKKMCVSTQTSLNEESYKKQLYKEISKYLSPNANSLIYEELFINKYAQTLPKAPQSPKRKKRG